MYENDHLETSGETLETSPFAIEAEGQEVEVSFIQTDEDIGEAALTDVD